MICRQNGNAGFLACTGPRSIKKSGGENGRAVGRCRLPMATGERGASL